MRCTVYAKEYNGKTQYSIGLSKKIGEEWYTHFIPAGFKKNTVIENKTKIDAKVFWNDFYKTKDDKTVTTIFINEFEILDKKDDSFSGIVADSPLPF